MKATREQVLAMAREIYGFINTTEEQLANIERLVHLAQQFTLDQLRAQGANLGFGCIARIPETLE